MAHLTKMLLLAVLEVEVVLTEQLRGVEHLDKVLLVAPVCLTAATNGFRLEVVAALAVLEGLRFKGYVEMAELVIRG